ncbi:glycosyltransferase [Pectobacterium carotovorum subsp. carotovorum]|uniref:glycosyltransferase n=1 Tax=Pectobacterium carotovorum TaxID=554 RepID=UPI00202D422D|nr:glycosyltransferase [Pectobacterium carotovorum]MCL6331925.1 glycosyltransferase [Pectobacterium carotovorum subsp. carotovorum]
MSYTPNAKLLGCVVTFNPEDVTDELISLSTKVSHLLVVENSNNSYLNLNKDNISVLFNYNKGGIAGALNKALEYGRVHGFDFLILFDQDSIVEEKTISKLMKSLTQNNLSIVGPRYKNSATKQPGFFYLDKYGIPFPKWIGDSVGLKESFFIINSGTIMNLSKIPRWINYDENLFVDCVDMDFCLTLRSSGVKCFIDTDVEMLHGLGNRNQVPSKLEPTNYNATRYNNLAKSKLILWKKWFVRFPLFVILDFFIFSLEIIRIAFFSERKMESLKAIASGFKKP